MTKLFSMIFKSCDNKYIVNIDRHPEDNSLEREVWTQRGVVHRLSEPAVTVRNAQGETVAREWWVHGQRHRDDGPAQVEDNGVWYREAWFLAGREHNKNSAAILEIHKPSGLVTREKWAVDGVEHRADGPSCISRAVSTGVVTVEAWRSSGLLHRLSGPARVLRDDQTGIPEEEEWFQNDQHHRLDGPAITIRNCQTGVIEAEHFYRQGIEVVPCERVNSPQPR